MDFFTVEFILNLKRVYFINYRFSVRDISTPIRLEMYSTLTY